MQSSSSTVDATVMSKKEQNDFINISHEEIKSATNNFADENLHKQGSSFKVYKGQLLLAGDFINIVVRVTKQTKIVFNEFIFSRELKHKNIASIFTDIVTSEDGFIVEKHETNGSLDKHLSGSTLPWMQRLRICVMVADALKYLHYDAVDNHHVLHGNIKSSKILLDHNYEPKLHGFGFALLVKKHHLHFIKDHNATLQYMDPSYENTRALTHKSDVFSFGVMLFEILFGREASIQNNDTWYFSRLARSHYEGSKLDYLIDRDLQEQMNSLSLKIFSEIAYHCLRENQSQRPDMKQVLSKLEKALELQQKHEHPIKGVVIEGISSSNNSKGKKFRLRDIELATNKFSEAYCIGSGGYGKVYKAQLIHNEINLIEAKNNGILPEKHSMVAIKRIFSRNDMQGEQGFLAEIEMLSNCKHPNVVSLHGFCDEEQEMILVYEYVPNGSLADYLEKNNNKTKLTWAQRIQICLDIAHGLKYLHTSTQNKQTIIHRDIKSANILLDDNWVAKIADFGLSRLYPANQQGSTLITNNIAGTEVYLDPEYMSTGKLKTKSDVYSFGVVLFEVMCGKLAYDKAYGQSGLPSIVRRYFNEGKLNSFVDPKIMEADENVLMLIGGVDQDSLSTFIKLAYQCLAKTQPERPTMEVAIKELEKALNYQKTRKDNLRIPLEVIKLGTENFSDCNCIGEGTFWKLYEGEVTHANVCSTILAKRWDNKFGKGHRQLLTEFDILSRYKHENIIGLVGYCNEENENIIVYEHASNGKLSKHLGDPSLTWMKRLKICINVAKGLGFLNRGGAGRVKDEWMIHGDIKSGSILLDGDWNAKISNFEMSRSPWTYERAEHLDDNDCNSMGYADPEYQKQGYLTSYSDIYSLGVILVEMVCGRLAWVEGCEDHSLSLGSLFLRRHEDGTLGDMIFKGIKEQAALESFFTFMRITTQCLQHDGLMRPSLDNIVLQLEKSLAFQKLNMKDNNLHISLKAIKLSTQNFSSCNCIEEGRFWKLYEGEIEHANRCTTIFAKRWDRKSGLEHIPFLTEVDILSRYKHENIIGLVGYCNEENEKIIVYEHTANGTLNKHLGDPSLTWMTRLKICIDVANGLSFFHKRVIIDHVPGMVHREIKSGSILLDGDWNAKISNFELSCEYVECERVNRFIYLDCNSLGYVDPEYKNYCYLTEYLDVYSLGVILFEMLCGRLAWTKGCEDHSESLGPLAVRHYNEKGSLDEMIFEGIKEQITRKSLTTYQTIALQCLEYDLNKRPKTSDVVIQLKKALKFQEEHETWESKLPIDYKEIIRASKTPEIYGSIEMKKDLYDMFSKGILLHGAKFFTLGSNGESNEMISARNFSYKNRKSHRWRHVEESRFEKVAEIFNISKLKIRTKITTRFLSPGVNYGAYIIFKFCDSRKISSKPMYVNLKYRKGKEKLQAYFATWRDDKWMMIELCRFLSHRKDTHFEVLLESFSRYHCGNSSIYVEGIEFRVIDNDKNKEIEQAPQQTRELNLMPNEANGMKLLMLSAKEALYCSSSVKHFHLKPSSESRFQEVIELLLQHVFRINCKIQSHMLSQDTEYLCYLVFKLSEKCVGLHCPVIVRDLVHQNKKPAEIIYFRSPSPWNLHENHSVPKRREDGWMEVKVWKFNSSHQLKNDCILVNLKLVAYGGTMSGLIVCGMEIRPM